MLDHQAMTQMMMRRVLVKVNMCVMSKSVKCDMQSLHCRRPYFRWQSGSFEQHNILPLWLWWVTGGGGHT